jgi:hypothetical protein
MKTIKINRKAHKIPVALERVILSIANYGPSAGSVDFPVTLSHTSTMSRERRQGRCKYGTPTTPSSQKFVPPGHASSVGS